MECSQPANQGPRGGGVLRGRCSGLDHREVLFARAPSACLLRAIWAKLREPCTLLVMLVAASPVSKARLQPFALVPPGRCWPCSSQPVTAPYPNHNPAPLGSAWRSARTLRKANPNTNPIPNPNPAPLRRCLTLHRDVQGCHLTPPPAAQCLTLHKEAAASAGRCSSCS